MASEARLIPDTALYISNIIGKLGINRKKSMTLCFTIEAALEQRIGQLNEQNPYLVIEVSDNVSEIEISITDKSVPYILTRNQHKILSRGLVDRFNFQQLGSGGQRISFFIRRDEPYLTYSPRLKSGDSGINKPCALTSVLRVLLRMVDAPTIFLFSSFFFYVGGFYPCSTRKFYQTKNKISKPYIPTPKVEGFTAKIGKRVNVNVIVLVSNLRREFCRH